MFKQYVPPGVDHVEDPRLGSILNTRHICEKSNLYHSHPVRSPRIITNHTETKFKNTITVTLAQIAKIIDHSLLHPNMTEAEIIKGLKTTRENNVAAACIKPYLIPLAKKRTCRL
ncbi:hypothetical protein BDW59DRAFT_6969 [Aspergillus cavernicola]|uniref:Uncharacterized protein n=1 Tax=Aspergillus cavernicola TaxID=176166 RepID=A0ABR4ITP3_9EURO